MSTNEWVQIICALSILTAVIGTVINRIQTNKGIGVRVIQFICAASIVPGLVLLSMNNKLDAAVAGILGALVGYLFSNIFRFEER